MTRLLSKTKPAESERQLPQNSVVDFLRNPKSFEDGTTHVELVETHISWVFLTDRFVYKLKKPVRFEFLDFGTIGQRHEACLCEVQLNRRLSPDIYLGVIPVTSDARGRLRLNSEGEPVDWVVKMARLPADKSLDRLIQQNRLTRVEVESLATLLSRFYQRLPPVTIHAAKYIGDIEHHLRANSEELALPKYGLDSWTLKRVGAAQMRFLCLRREDLIDRVRDGRVVDGHGDLRPEHIYIDGSPKIIDCIEFSSEFRTIDVADELAFLTMECERLDAEWVGQKILEQYCQTSNDRIGQSIVDFFKCYRACVRAKVSALRSQQVSGLEGQKLLGNCNTYLRLADRYAEQLGPPALFVVRGLSGTGKSTLAAALSESLGCDYLQTDILRRQLFGTPADSSDFNRGRYTPQNRQQVYDEMFQVAGNYLSHRCSIILDGTFLTARLRQRALQLAREHSAEALLIHCTCPSSVAAERVRERQESSETTSEIRPEFLELQRQQEEPDNEAWPVCTIDTSDGLAPVLRTVYDRLRSLVLAATPQ